MTTDIDRLNIIRQHNSKSHICTVSEEDYDRIMPKIELLKRLSEIERSLYAVYDMHKQNYLLKSVEQKKLFGFTGDESREDEAELHFSQIHPEDLPFVLETDIMTFRFFSELPAEEKKDYKLVYDFRTKNTEGIYIRFMHQMIIFETDRKGKAWLNLVISDLLSERNADSKPQRRLINMKTGKLHLFNEGEGDSKSLLTKRETEILKLIAYGYDSINISDRLHISINTVNNHRQNILRKTRTENTTRALLYCKRLGLI